MGRKLNEVIAALPAERRRKIDALAQARVEDMLASARTLADIRKAVGKTQVEVAQALGVKQHAISQLEQRSDTYLSTFKRFLAGMGMHLELSVVTADGARVELSEFRLPEAEGGTTSAPVPALAKALASEGRPAAVAAKARVAPKRAQTAAGSEDGARVTPLKKRPAATRHPSVAGRGTGNSG